MSMIDISTNQHTESFVEEASFLLTQRHHIANSWDSGLEVLKAIDERLEAAIEGMLLSPEVSVKFCEPLIKDQEIGAIGIMAMLYVLTQKITSLEALLNKAIKNQSHQQIIIEALSWLPIKELKPILNNQLFSTISKQLLLTDILINHRYAPQQMKWSFILEGSSIPLKNKALRLAAYTCMPHYHLPETRTILHLPWYHWYSAFLGERFQAPLIIQAVEEAVIPWKDALPVLLMWLKFAEISTLIKHWLSQEKTQSLAIMTIGLYGHPEYCEILFSLWKENLSLQEQKKIANAIRLISGNYIALEDEVVDITEELTEMQALDFLDVPDRKKMYYHWKSTQNVYQANQRYRCGQPLEQAGLEQQLQQGRQLDRYFASIELAILMKTPVYPTMAPYWRQKQT